MEAAEGFVRASRTVRNENLHRKDRYNLLRVL